MNLSVIDLLPVGFVLLLSACAATTAHRSTGTPDPLNEFLAKDGREVLTFVGYSGAGYQDEAAMLKAAATILDQHDPARTLVNIGVTPDGIGAVYKLAKERGFTTMGIVSTRARELPPSKHVDQIFYIVDNSWGGIMEGTDELSPTSTYMVESSDKMVGIGGGAIARDELSAARKAGKSVTFIPADKNHKTAIEKARKKGQPAPTNFAGEAASLF